MCTGWACNCINIHNFFVRIRIMNSMCVINQLKFINIYISAIGEFPSCLRFSDPPHRRLGPLLGGGALQLGPTRVLFFGGGQSGVSSSPPAHKNTHRVGSCLGYPRACSARHDVGGPRGELHKRHLVGDVLGVHHRHPVPHPAGVSAPPGPRVAVRRVARRQCAVTRPPGLTRAPGSVRACAYWVA